MDPILFTDEQIAKIAEDYLEGNFVPINDMYRRLNADPENSSLVKLLKEEGIVPNEDIWNRMPGKRLSTSDYINGAVPRTLENIARKKVLLNEKGILQNCYCSSEYELTLQLGIFSSISPSKKADLIESVTAAYFHMVNRYQQESKDLKEQ